MKNLYNTIIKVQILMGIVSKNRRKRNKKQKEKMRTLKITTLPSVKEQPF